jgi:hypothetical protein
LESHVRRRVGAIDNVEILDGHDFVEPIAATPHRVTGADIVNRDTGRWPRSRQLRCKSVWPNRMAT